MFLVLWVRDLTGQPLFLALHCHDLSGSRTPSARGLKAFKSRLHGCSRVKSRRGWKSASAPLLNWSRIVADREYIEKLRGVILQRHGCESSWVESLPVHDVYGGEIIWNGMVEVFRLSGHPKTKTAYAWIDEEAEEDGAERVETALEIQPVDSPLSAVQASMLAGFMRGL